MPHLRGNIFIQYAHVASAIRAFIALDGRYYDGFTLKIHFTLIRDWKQAICAYNGSACPKYSECNFLHVFTNPGNAYAPPIEKKNEKGGRRDTGPGSTAASGRQRYSNPPPLRHDRDRDRDRERKQERSPKRKEERHKEKKKHEKKHRKRSSSSESASASGSKSSRSSSPSSAKKPKKKADRREKHKRNSSESKSRSRSPQKIAQRKDPRPEKE